jgi:C-terminal processing protease CtpA/Prc
MAKFRYNELCFVFDNLFGYPGSSIMEQNGMAEKGFDATLDVVQNGQIVKKLLQSSNNIDFAWGRMAMQYLIYDGGHTNLSATTGVPAAIVANYIDQVVATAANHPEASAMYQKWLTLTEERYELNLLLEQMRNQALGDVLYKANDSKTTAIIIINSFNDMDENAWNKYYASPKTDTDWQELMKSYEKDNFIALLYGLQQAKADGVKNLVIDITMNGGGSCDIVGADVAILRNNRTVQFWSQDVLEGKNKIATYYVDNNFDGVFDEKDDTNPKFDCSGMNIGVLCSKVAFSCGHQFPTLMKDYGFPIMGERSGGGTCCIQVMQTADGQNFMISTYRDRSTDKNFANTDEGITPTEGYTFSYDHFYDLDFLTSKLQR